MSAKQKFHILQRASANGGRKNNDSARVSGVKLDAQRASGRSTEASRNATQGETITASAPRAERASMTLSMPRSALLVPYLKHIARRSVLSLDGEVQMKVTTRRPIRITSWERAPRHVLALFLLPFIRDLISRPVPAFVINKRCLAPVPG